jgi:hypothetical protein
MCVAKSPEQKLFPTIAGPDAATAMVDSKVPGFFLPYGCIITAMLHNYNNNGYGDNGQSHLHSVAE